MHFVSFFDQFSNFKRHPWEINFFRSVLVGIFRFIDDRTEDLKTFQMVSTLEEETEDRIVSRQELRSDLIWSQFAFL